MKKMKKVLLLVLALVMVMSMATGVFAKPKKKKLKVIQPKVVDMMYSCENGDNNYKSNYIFGYIELENKNKFHLKDVVLEINVLDENGKRVTLEKQTMDIIEKEATGVLAIQVDYKGVDKPQLKVKVKKVTKKNILKDKRPDYVLPSDFEVKKVEDIPDGAIFSFKNKTKYDELEPRYIKMFRNEEGEIYFGRDDYLWEKVDAGETVELEIGKPKDDCEIIIKLIARFHKF